MVWYGMVWYGMVWYGMVWYGMVWYAPGHLPGGGQLQLENLRGGGMRKSHPFKKCPVGPNYGQI